MKKELINYSINKYSDLKLCVYKENKKALEFYLNRAFKIVAEEFNEESGHTEYLMQQ